MRQNELQNVVAIAGDAGGANAIAPVIKQLRMNGTKVVALAYKQAPDVWSRHEIECEEVPESMTPEDAVNLLVNCQACALLAATSFNGIDLEKRFIFASQRLSLPSLSVLDFWSNYRERFADRDGQPTLVPDRIAVMDDLAQKEVIESGVSARQICVTGQPAFDELFCIDEETKSHFRRSVRNTLQIDDVNRLVLFASQPFAKLYGNDVSSPRYLGYTEHSVLRDLVDALEEIAETSRNSITLLIRPHPREDEIDYPRINQPKFRTLIDSGANRLASAVAADLVVGMSSILLIEALLLECNVLSIQPGLRFVDMLPTNRSGATTAIYRSSDIRPLVHRCLFDEELRRTAASRKAIAHYKPGATGRVIGLLESLVQSPASVIKGESRLETLGN